MVSVHTTYEERVSSVQNLPARATGQQGELYMPKRTHQPKTRRRARVHGFRARMSSRAGRLVLKARRLKNRAKLSV